MAGARKIHQDAPHQPSTQSKEVGAVLPLNIPQIH
jgi:hypothetical protein